MGIEEAELLCAMGQVGGVVDIQNDFCPGGGLAVPRGDEVVPIVNRLAAQFANVILTQDWHPAGHGSFASQHPGKSPLEMVQMPYGPQVLWPDHCVQGSRGAEFHAALAAHHAQAVIRKGYHAHTDSYSALLEADRVTPTGLKGMLRERGVRREVLAGDEPQEVCHQEERDRRGEAHEHALGSSLDLHGLPRFRRGWISATLG